MEDSHYRAWDVALKIIALIGIAIGGIVSYWQYFDGVARQQKTAVIEASKPFLAQRQQLYGEAIRAVAQLAVSSNAANLKRAEEAFWDLYWGPLASVESKDVEGLMVEMGRCLTDQPNCGQREKQLISLKLAHQIRIESAQSWGVVLPTLAGRP